jgi:hypothetical protein
MRALLDSIPVTREMKIPAKHGGGVRIVPDIKGLRDRAVIAIMDVALALQVEDFFRQSRAANMASAVD